VAQRIRRLERDRESFATRLECRPLKAVNYRLAASSTDCCPERGKAIGLDVAIAVRSLVFVAARSLAALASPLWLGLRSRGSADDQLSQGGVERMFGIGAIEALIAIAPAGDEMSRFEFASSS